MTNFRYCLVAPTPAFLSSRSIIDMNWLSHMVLLGQKDIMSTAAVILTSLPLRDEVPRSWSSGSDARIGTHANRSAPSALNSSRMTICQFWTMMVHVEARSRPFSGAPRAYVT
jgi:hypothetical protein